MRFPRCLFLLGLAASPLLADVTDPHVTAWLTDAAGNYARLYQSDAARSAGTSSTTWSRGSGVQTSPAYAGVTQVQYSDSWVYVRSTGLGYHVMGPWYLDAARAQNFPNFPANTNVLYRIPRQPAVPAAKTLTGLGAIGYGVDGVALFDNRDAYSYVHASATDATPVNGLHGDGVWNRDAYVNEAVTFDAAFAHQAGAQYHYHANTPALRYLLDDNVEYRTATKTYAEKSTAPAKHSPILGFMADGYPVYGPYGYASPMDAGSGVRRMISGYVKRDGTNGTSDLNAIGRTSLPAWAQRAQGRTTVSTSLTGPSVNTTYPLGHYIEDYDYLGDLGRTQGVDFDLDEYNGRFCVTPEYPQGTYAYFISIEADGTPKFPYIVGRWYYGNPTGGTVSSIGETVTEYQRGAPAAAITLSGTAAGDGVTLHWNSAEGATYRVESSADGSGFTTLNNAVTSGGATTTYTAPAVASYYRVTLTAIATYDTTATVGTPVGTTATLHYTTSGSEATGTASTDTSTSTSTTSTTTTPVTTTGSSTTTTATTTTSSSSSSGTSASAGSGTGSGGGGGGGAPSDWFLASLAGLAMARRFVRRR